MRDTTEYVISFHSSLSTMASCLLHSMHLLRHVMTHLLAMFAETTVNRTVEMTMSLDMWLVTLYVMMMTVMVDNYNSCVVAVVVSQIWCAACK